MLQMRDCPIIRDVCHEPGMDFERNYGLRNKQGKFFSTLHNLEKYNDTFV